ncbi:MAG: exo-alpha-sialidase [Planctomycetes bacterium]|nr:exo-alpha-sialidase [Planctomycetota bacterium]
MARLLARAAASLAVALALAGAAKAQGRGYGPWNNDLVIATSTDGLRFTLQGTFVERGGVPSIAEGERGRLIAAFQWFPLDDRERFDKIAVRTSDDGGKTWTDPQTIEIAGMPETLHRAFDPTIVALEGGRWRLYFSSERAGQLRGNRAIFSAVSDDGIRYTFEEGMRFGFDRGETYDCAVARIRNEWHLYCPAPGQGVGYHAVSRDGLAFEQVEDVQVMGARDWLGCALAVDGGLRFYGSGEGGWSAFSKDGDEWIVDMPARFPGADPGVARNRDGLYIMIATGPLRSDAKPGAGPFGPEAKELAPVPLIEARPRPVEIVRPPAGASIAANQEYVYVLRGDTIFQYDARTLRLIRTVRVEEPEPRPTVPRPERR